MAHVICSIPDCGEPHLSRGWCSKHYYRWKRNGDPLITKRTPPIAESDTEKWCPRCEAKKPLAEFGIRSTGTPKGYCQSCEASYQLSYVQTEEGLANHRRAAVRYSKGPRHDFDLRKRYGIGAEDYEAMLEAQQGRCAICKTERPYRNGDEDRRWNVDHDHLSGRVRGLLCNSCNLGIGKFYDDPELLRTAAAYIERHRLVT